MRLFLAIADEIARALALLALVLLSFVQQPVAIERYGVSPAVTVAIDCGTGRAGDRDDKRARVNTPCDACRIAIAIDLPELAVPVTSLGFAPASGQSMPRHQIVRLALDRIGGGPRAPPGRVAA